MRADNGLAKHKAIAEQNKKEDLEGENPVMGEQINIADLQKCQAMHPTGLSPRDQRHNNDLCQEVRKR